MKISQKNFSNFLAAKLDEAASTKTKKKDIVNEVLSDRMGKSDLDLFDQLVIGQPIPGKTTSMCFYKDSTSALTIDNKNFLEIWDMRTRQITSAILNDRSIQFLKRAI